MECGGAAKLERHVVSRKMTVQGLQRDIKEAELPEEQSGTCFCACVSGSRVTDVWKNPQLVAEEEARLLLRVWPQGLGSRQERIGSGLWRQAQPRTPNILRRNQAMLISECQGAQGNEQRRSCLINTSKCRERTSHTTPFLDPHPHYGTSNSTLQQILSWLPNNASPISPTILVILEGPRTVNTTDFLIPNGHLSIA